MVGNYWQAVWIYGDVGKSEVVVYSDNCQSKGVENVFVKAACLKPPSPYFLLRVPLLIVSSTLILVIISFLGSLEGILSSALA